MMQDSLKRSTLELIADDLREVGYETRLVNDEGTDTLGFLMPLYEDGGQVYTEVFISDLAAEFSTLVFFTTLIAEIGDGMDELALAVSDWNLTGTLGAYGIYAPKRQLYHRFAAVIDANSKPLETGLLAQRVFYAMFEELRARLATAIRIADGELSYADAASQQLI